ncbi:WGR domain-containing protein [Sphingopyxis sp. R3-92]|uniref:WGR domain-containing protein n=1 Tax=Sphingopyxis sp. R3-92 TaxID=3158553 RepID=UPI003EE4808E
METTAPFDDVEIELIARNPARNIHRRYKILASVDLFGAVIVETRWGRIGAAGQHKIRSFAFHPEADRYVRSILARRNSAEARLGAPYRIQTL